MNDIFNGWANIVTIQKEDNFNGSSAQTPYTLIGKTRFTQQQSFTGRTNGVDVWRNQTTTILNSSIYTGTIEIEFGFNVVVQMLIQSLFEVVSTSSITGGLTQTVFRPARLQPVQSFKIGMSYDGKSFWIYGGLVLDSIRLTVRRNQIPSVSLAFKAASLNLNASSSLLGVGTTVDKNPTLHTSHSMTVDGTSQVSLSESNLIFQQIKTAGKFTRIGQAGIFSSDAFTMKGQFAEYFNSSSVFPAYAQNQDEHDLVLNLADPAGTARAFQCSWPRVVFQDALPDAIGKTDLVYRANVNGLQDTIIGVSAPTLTLTV